MEKNRKPQECRVGEVCTLKERRYTQYSKILTTIFSIFMFPLAIYVVYRCLYLAELAITSGFTGALPYVTAIVGFVEASSPSFLPVILITAKKKKLPGRSTEAVRRANKFKRIFKRRTP